MLTMGDDVISDGSYSLVGAAALVGSTIRLTPESTNKAGAVWANLRIDVTKSFTVSADVIITGTGTHADGFALLIQNDPNGLGSIGGLEGGMGYAGPDITPSVIVQFDTYLNAGESDPAVPHVSIFKDGEHIHGTAGELTTAVSAPNLTDGLSHSVLISYDGTTMTVDYDGGQILSVAVDLETTIGARWCYVGWTAGTGADTSQHDLSNWQLTASRRVTGTTECYNTRETCQDPANFTKGTQTLRFANRRLKPPPSPSATWVALDGDATGEVVVPDSADFDISPYMTVEILYLHDSADDARTVTIVGRNSFAGTTSWTMRDINGMADFFFRPTAGTSFTASFGSVSDGLWHRLSAVVDQASNTVKAYLDGVLVDTTSTTGSGIVASSEPIQIGGLDDATWPAGQNDINGKVADLRLWDDVRSDLEISDNKDYGAITGSDSRLVGLWLIDENTGSTVSDSTANSNDGTMTGMAWATATEDLAFSPATWWEQVHAFPSLTGVDLAATEINDAKDLGTRGRATAVLQDFIHGDAGIDDYRDNRTHDTYQGTFFTKLRVRNPFLIGRTMRVKRGFLDDDGYYKAENFSSRTYIIERMNGPSSSDGWTIVGKDILKLADDERAQAPVASSGALLADITDSETSLILGSGEGAAYGTSGTVRIGDEVMTFSGRTDDTLTGLVRGTDGTAAEAHTASDRVQLCLRYSSQSADIILADLLQTYAGVDSSFLDTANWATTLQQWFPARTYTALITEPTAVRKLLNELIEVAMIVIWWDERDALVKIDATRPPRRLSSLSLFDDSNTISNSVLVSEDEKQRITQSWVLYDRDDQTKNLDEATNYLKGSFSIDADAESANQYNGSRVRRLLTRWLESTDNASAAAISSRTKAAFIRPKLKVTFSLDAKDNSVWTGDLVRLQFRQVVDFTGAPVEFAARIISSEESEEGDQVNYLAERTGFKGRYCFIGPSTLVDYADESDENREIYAFISDSDSLMSDNSEAYKII